MLTDAPICPNAGCSSKSSTRHLTSKLSTVTSWAEHQRHFERLALPLLTTPTCASWYLGEWVSRISKIEKFIFTWSSRINGGTPVLNSIRSETLTWAAAWETTSTWLEDVTKETDCPISFRVLKEWTFGTYSKATIQKLLGRSSIYQGSTLICLLERFH